MPLMLHATRTRRTTNRRSLGLTSSIPSMIPWSSSPIPMAGPMSSPAKNRHRLRRPPGAAAPRAAAATATILRLQARSPGPKGRAKRRNDARRNGGREAAVLTGTVAAIDVLVAAAVAASPVAAEAESTAMTVGVVEAAASTTNVAVEAPAMTGTSTEVARPAVAIGRSAAAGAASIVNALIIAEAYLQTILLFSSARTVCLANLLKPRSPREITASLKCQARIPNM